MNEVSTEVCEQVTTDWAAHFGECHAAKAERKVGDGEFPKAGGAA
ncbi:MAG: hypothetical protein V1784_09690 [bacterium]